MGYTVVYGKWGVEAEGGALAPGRSKRGEAKQSQVYIL